MLAVTLAKVVQPFCVQPVLVPRTPDSAALFLTPPRDLFTASFCSSSFVTLLSSQLNYDKRGVCGKRLSGKRLSGICRQMLGSLWSMWRLQKTKLSPAQLPLLFTVGVGGEQPRTGCDNSLRPLGTSTPSGHASVKTQSYRNEVLVPGAAVPYCCPPRSYCTLFVGISEVKDLFLNRGGHG